MGREASVRAWLSSPGSVPGPSSAASAAIESGRPSCGRRCRDAPQNNIRSARAQNHKKAMNEPSPFSCLHGQLHGALRLPAPLVELHRPVEGPGLLEVARHIQHHGRGALQGAGRRVSSRGFGIGDLGPGSGFGGSRPGLRACSASFSRSPSMPWALARRRAWVRGLGSWVGFVG